jgi:threonine aldolase
LVALLVHCPRGNEYIIGDRAHAFLLEAGGATTLGSIVPRALANQPDGTINLDEVEMAIRPDNVHFPRTRLICLENSHNRCGGAVLTPEYISSISQLADRRGLAVHLDGARIFNAAMALRVDVKQLTRDVDSVMFCLSKGLSAPVGSILCGDGDFVGEALRIRKMVGGGMRQVGVIAAAGIVALETMVERLAEDHANARRLAGGLCDIPGFSLSLDSVQTNIVIFELTSTHVTAAELTAGLAERGVQLLPIGGSRFRAVTHRGIEARDIDTALNATREVVAK